MKIICSECKREIIVNLYESTKIMRLKLNGFLGKERAMNILNEIQDKSEDFKLRKKCQNCK